MRLQPPRPSRALGADLGLSAAIAGVVSLLGMTVYPVADDWALMADVELWIQQNRLLSEPFRAQAAHWSPLWFLTNGVCYAMSDYRFGAIPLASVRFVALTTAIAVLMTFLRLGSVSMHRASAVIGALVFAFHQSHVGALFQWKAVGAVSGHALGALSALLVCRRLTRSDSNGVAALPSVLLFCGLLYKETVLAWGAFVSLLLAVSLIWETHDMRRRTLRVTLPLIMTCLGFVLIRHLAGAPVNLPEEFSGSSDMRYGLAGPMIWIRNAFYVGLATLTPISTVRWIDAFRAADWILLASFGGATVLINSVIARGLFLAASTNSKRTLIKWAVLGLLVAAFPVALMAHVSEGYVSPSVFWYSILFAVGASGLMKEAPLQSGRLALLSLLVIVVGLHIFFFIEKRGMMAASGRQELGVLTPAVTALRSVPAGARVCLDVPPIAGHYSYYRVFAADAVIGFGVAKSGLLLDVTATHECDYRMTLRRDAIDLRKDASR